MGGFKRGLFGECFWKSGDGVTTLGCSLCMQESWYTASLNPSCWQCLIFPEHETGPDGFDLPTHDLWSSEDEIQTNIFGTFMNRFRCKYEIDERRFSITVFIKFVVNRSRGHATFLRLPGCCTFEALKYVADVCPRLTALSLPIYLVHQRPRIIPQLIAKWKHLEELSVGSSLDLKKTLSEISIHCKKFWRLHVANAYIGNAEALAIVKLVPDIKHLSLRRADIGRDNIVMLLQGCKELVVLNFSDCRGFDGGDDEIYTLASHITNFRCEGSFSDCCTDCDDYYERNAVYLCAYESD
ncbi:uncharacterized protein LOC110764503 [Prunus avium]|uniref:Uncharacterized protein LOC110764503 n=1 Tax=Prunus avium TaxID=42229 RepID=A0A6P5T7N0_PRUAV|nr:uncharacterized protein LOC110764503 [Prunus avium]